MPVGSFGEAGGGGDGFVAAEHDDGECVDDVEGGCVGGEPLFGGGEGAGFRGGGPVGEGAFCGGAAGVFWISPPERRLNVNGIFDTAGLLKKRGPLFAVDYGISCCGAKGKDGQDRTGDDGPLNAGSLTG